MSPREATRRIMPSTHGGCSIGRWSRFPANSIPSWKASLIAIRTAIVKDGQLHVQAGAGIVADSEPSAEWQETQNKARAVLRAAELAEQGLDTRF